MKIYLIKIEKYDYDCYSAFVIVAYNEEEVRTIAKQSCGQEGEYVWEDAPITIQGDYTGLKILPFCLLSSFHAG